MDFNFSREYIWRRRILDWWILNCSVYDIHPFTCLLHLILLECHHREYWTRNSWKTYPRQCNRYRAVRTRVEYRLYPSDRLRSSWRSQKLECEIKRVYDMWFRNQRSSFPSLFVETWKRTAPLVYYIMYHHLLYKFIEETSRHPTYDEIAKSTNLRN